MNSYITVRMLRRTHITPSTLILVAISTMSTVLGNANQTDICTLCPNNDTITSTYPPGEEETCQNLATQAAQISNSSSPECLSIQNQATFCGCTTTPTPNSCTLCHDGAPPLNLDAKPNLPGYISASIFSPSSATDRSIPTNPTCRDLWKELLLHHNSSSTQCIASQTLTQSTCTCNTTTATPLTSPCTLCADGSYPTDPGARITLPGNTGRVNCSTLHSIIAPTLLSTSSQCTNLRSAGINLCGCPDLYNKCPLCVNGKYLPSPGLEIQPGITCQKMAQTAQVDEPSHCPAYQLTAGVYCECDETYTYENTCRICGKDKLLPDPKIVVKNDRGEISNCLRVELEANVPGDYFTDMGCEEYQRMYEVECGCVEVLEVTEMPTPSPVSGGGRVKRGGWRVMVVLGILVLGLV